MVAERLVAEATTLEVQEDAVLAVVEAERHEVLRTTYASSDDGHPFQVIAPEQRLHLTIVDLSQNATSEREDEARRISQEEASKPFDLARDPITRNLLVKIADNW